MAQDNIVSFVGFEDTALPKIQTVFEGPSLEKMADKLGMCSLEEEKQHHVLIGICKGLGHLNEKGIVHHDIKPANIVYNPSTCMPRIIDFGMACSTAQCTTDATFGTPHYMPPEVLFLSRRTHKGDVWGAGVVLLYVSRCMPLPREPWNLADDSKQKFKELKDWIAKVEAFQERLPKGPEPWSLVNDMLMRDPKERLSGRELVAKTGGNLLAVAA